MSGTFEGRVAIITGASRGIGQACAEVLLRDGATVVGCSREEPDQLGFGERYTHRQVDVTDLAGLETFVHWTVERFSRLDVLVNNAGAHPPKQAVDDVSSEAFEGLVRQNLTSVFVSCRAALPALRAVHGSIVNIGSAVGLFGQEGAAAYCATKGAISGLTKALAIDEGIHGVRVNCVCPGAIRTSRTATSNKEYEALVGSFAWLDRWGDAREVAELVAFLASDRASFITGQDILIGGGTELGYGLKAHNYRDAMAVAGKP